MRVAGFLMAGLFAAAGCGPHHYLETYVGNQGKYAYMNPPSSLNGPGTVVIFQRDQMLTLYTRESAFPKVTIEEGPAVLPCLDSKTTWKGSLSLAFDFMPSGTGTGLLKAKLVSNGAQTVKFSFGNVKVRMVPCGGLVEAMKAKEGTPAIALEFLRKGDAAIIVGVLEVSEMTFDFADNSDFTLNLDSPSVLKELGNLTDSSLQFAAAGSKAFKIAFSGKPLNIGYHLWRPSFKKMDFMDEPDPATRLRMELVNDPQQEIMYAPLIARLRQQTP
jgi:hypothetical protein